MSESLPTPVYVDLTDEQAAALCPLFEWLSLQPHENPCMILAQVFVDFMRVGVIGHEEAQQIACVMRDGKETTTTSYFSEAFKRCKAEAALDQPEEKP